MAVEQSQYLQAAEFISPWQRVLLFGHERADGDSLGALVGLSRMLESTGKQCGIRLFEPVPEKLEIIAKARDLAVFDPHASLEGCDGIIILDTCAASQVGPLLPALSAAPPTLVLDHHVTRDLPVTHAVIDEHASSVSLLVCEWAEAAGWTPDLPAATALFTGMAMDTGWFRHSNTDARTLEHSARMVAVGVQPSVLFQAFYMSDSVSRLRLLGRVLCDMELHYDQQVAVLVITQAVLEACAARMEDVDEVVNEVLRARRIIASMLLIESEPQMTKVKLRSKSRVNCATTAARFGGGGHVRAAGAVLKCDLPTARKQLLDAIGDDLSLTEESHA